MLACRAKVPDRLHLKILSPKIFLQKLPTALAQVNEGNTFENLVDEIRQIIYSLYRVKQITKILYNNITNSISVTIQNKYYIYEF